MSTFFTTSPEKLSGLPSPEFSAAIESLNWNAFSPETDAKPLYDALKQNAKQHGVSEGHFLATKKLHDKEALRLENPYAHNAEIVAAAISPDGKLFATGSFVGDDYDAGGQLLIFDVKTGKVFMTVHVEGGAGWPDYPNCIQFSPDSQKIGLSHNTNAVGYLSFGMDYIEYMCWITDGWSRPPGFCWHADNKQMLVSCWGEYKEPGEKLFNIPGCLVNWEKDGVEELHWAQQADSPFGDDLQPWKVCFGYNDVIVGYNFHEQCYALDAKTLKPVWWKNWGRVFFGKQVMLHYEDDLIIAQTPGDLKEVFRVAAEDGLEYLAVSNADTATPVFALYDGNDIAKIFRGDQHLCNIVVCPASEPETGLKTMSISSDEQYFACLKDTSKVVVYRIGASPELVHESMHEYAEGVFLGEENTLVLAGTNYTCFIDFMTGEMKGKYYYDRPDHKHLLMLKDNDYSNRCGIRSPLFPVQKDGDAVWGYAFNSMHCLIPEGTPINELPAWSLKSYVTWPWEWTAWVRVNDMYEYAALPGCSLSEELLELYAKRPEPVAKQAKKKGDAEEAFIVDGPETIEDLISEFMDVLTLKVQQGYHSHVQDYLCKLAILYSKKGMLEHATETLEKIDAAFSKLVAGAWMLYYAKGSGKELEGLHQKCEGWFTECQEDHEYLRGRSNSIMGGIHAMQGNKAASEKNFSLALENKDNDSNSGETVSYYLQGLYLAGDINKLLVVMEEETDSLFTSAWMPVYAELCKTMTLDDLVRLMRIMKEKGVDLDGTYMDKFTAVVIRSKKWDCEALFEELFEGWSTSEAVEKVLRSMKGVESDENIRAQVTALVNSKLEWPDSWIDAALLGAELFPDEAQAWLESSGKDFEQLVAKSYYKGEFFGKYMRLMQLAEPLTGDGFAKSFANHPKVEFAIQGALGILAVMGSGAARENLVRSVMDWVATLKDSQPDYWAKIAAEAWRGGMEKETEECMKKGLAACKGSSKDYEMEKITDALAEVGAFQFAYRSWMKNPGKSHYMDGLLRGLANAGKIHGMLQLIRTVDATDLNGRGAKFREMICLLEKIDWDDLAE